MINLADNQNNQAESRPLCNKIPCMFYICSNVDFPSYHHPKPNHYIESAKKHIAFERVYSHGLAKIMRCARIWLATNIWGHPLLAQWSKTRLSFGNCTDEKIYFLYFTGCVVVENVFYLYLETNSSLIWSVPIGVKYWNYGCLFIFRYSAWTN